MTKDDIKKIRKTLGMTQQQFAEMLGCSLYTVARWETGKFKISQAYINLIKKVMAEWK